MKYTEPFSSIDKTKSGIFGAKTASLGEMLQNNIPVPDGFGISAQACRNFSEKVLTAGFIEELYESFDRLGAEKVAVRSSALAEDGSGASWAGQLNSYLNVTRDTLLESVEKCWKSIKNKNVSSYTEGKNVTTEDLLVGVVVQKMVNSEKSGVMFTADPVNHDKNAMVVESIYGLGELIVQGTISPDHWDITKKPLEVSGFDIAIKDRQMLFVDGKNRIVAVDETKADRASLREDEVLELVAIGQLIEDHYGSPQDIEWAYEAGRFYIVQSRPITTL